MQTQRPALRSAESRPLRRNVRNRGFSLIELLVVISIIGLLAGIGFVAARAMMEQAKIEQANSTVRALAGIPTEILAATDAPLRYKNYPSATPSYSAVAYPADRVDPTDPDAWHSINFLIRRGNQNPKTKTMLQSINRDFFRGDPDDITTQYFVDPWGQPLRFSAYSEISPGVANDEFYGASATNSGFGTYEEERGMPKQRTPYVASAGPDGLWGAFDPDGQIPDAAAADNIYSFQLTE